MAIRPGKRKTNLKEGYTFSSSFEERKTLEYLRNLISSKFLHSRPLVLFQFSVTALGQKTVVGLLEKACPEICGNENFAEWVAYDKLDLCLYGKNHGYDPKEVAPAAGLTTQQVEWIYRDIDGKRQFAGYLHSPAVILGK